MLILLSRNWPKSLTLMGTALVIAIIFRVVGNVFVPMFYSGAISLMALYGIAVCTAVGILFLGSWLLPKISLKFNLEK